MKTILAPLLIAPLFLSACAPTPEAPSQAELLTAINAALRIESGLPRQASADGSVVAPSILSIEQPTPGSNTWRITLEGAWLHPFPDSPEPGVVYHQLRVEVNGETGEVESYSADK